MKECIECGFMRRETQFSLVKGRETEGQRKDVCRVCGIGGFRGDQQEKILKELYKNYLVYRESYLRTGRDILTHSVETTAGSNEYMNLAISFTDLKEGVGDLAPRKKEAFYLHIICDMRQREVAEIMGCTTVTVGQYVDSAVAQLCKRYFSDNDN